MCVGVFLCINVGVCVCFGFFQNKTINKTHKKEKKENKATTIYKFYESKNKKQL